VLIIWFWPAAAVAVLGSAVAVVLADYVVRLTLPVVVVHYLPKHRFSKV
jgi:hypothetical protein